MNVHKVIAPKTCEWCHDPFTPTRPEQRFCPRPAACANLFFARRRRGVVPVEAIAAMKRKRLERITAACAEQFGELSEREGALVRFALSLGYDRGYAAALKPVTARKASA